MELLEVNYLCKTYGSGETAVHALKDVSFSVPKGEYVAVVGESEMCIRDRPCVHNTRTKLQKHRKNP